MVDEDSDEPRSVDTGITQRRNTPRVTANGIGQPDPDDGYQEEPGAARSSSSGAPASMALAVRDNVQQPGAEGTMVPTAAHLGVDAGVALQPFGVQPNGLSDLGATQIVGPEMGALHGVAGYPGATSNSLYPQTLSSPVTQLQVMSPNVEVNERGRILQEQRTDGTQITVIEWTRRSQQFVDQAGISRIAMGNLLQQNKI